MECSVISIYWLYRDENIFIPKSSVKADLFKQETVVQNIVEDTETRFSGGQYKEEYSLAGPALIRQLYACCSDELKQGLSRSTGGGQFSLTESNLLKLMRQLAVRYQNPAVHVQEFLSMSQQQEEPVRHYLTRLRGTAARCNFMEKCATCNKDVSYADSVIRFKLISGLSDQEIKEDILSVEDKTLDETVKAVEAKESGKVARRAVGNSTAPSKVAGVADATSKQTPKCGYCGRSGHTSDISDREKNCPAWNKTCSRCDKKSHFAVVCRFKKKKAREAEHAGNLPQGRPEKKKTRGAEHAGNLPQGRFKKKKAREAEHVAEIITRKCSSQNRMKLF